MKYLIIITFIKVTGIFFFIIGAIFLTRSLFLANFKETTISKILERKSGINYQTVSKGSEYPCKIEVVSTERDRKYVFNISSEHDPCSPFLTGMLGKYYQIGDKVNIRLTSDLMTAEINDYMSLYIVPFLIMVIGFIMIFFYKPKLLSN